MLKRIIALFFLLLLLPTIPVFAEDDEDEEEQDLIIMPEIVPRGANGENQFIVPIGFKDNNLPVPMGAIYEDLSLKDFNKKSPALYTCRMKAYTSGYKERSINAEKVFDMITVNSKLDVLHLDPMWAIVRHNGQLAYVKRHRISNVEAVNPATTAPYGVQKPQYVATTADVTEVHVSMTHDDMCWVVLDPGTKLSIWKIVDGWAVVIYWRTYAYIDINDLKDLTRVSPTDEALNDDTPIAAYTSFYKMTETEMNANRLHNIALGCQRMSVVLQPGESFDCNKQMGPYSADTGYLIAGTLANETSSSGYGGGTCQVSSTIYNALLQLPGVKILQRRPHGNNGAPYLPHGVDAAVGNDSLNLRFRNDYDFPIRLEGNTSSDGALCWLIYRADIEEAK